MKLNSAFLTHDDNGQKLIVSTGASKFAGLVRSNEPAGFIIGCLEQETTLSEITEKMAARYDAPRDVIERDVKNIIDQLRKIGAIDE